MLKGNESLIVMVVIFMANKTFCLSVCVYVDLMSGVSKQM